MNCYMHDLLRVPAYTHHAHHTLHAQARGGYEAALEPWLQELWDAVGKHVPLTTVPIMVWVGVYGVADVPAWGVFLPGVCGSCTGWLERARTRA